MWSSFQTYSKISQSPFTYTLRSVMTITGSSYLFPTLRLSRFDSPETISSKIDAELARNKAAESMLTLGKTWRVPIVLDLAALAPDGSPHYSPPSVEILEGFVNALDKRGMKVIGLANIANCGGIAEDAASSLGIPAVFGVRMVSSASSFDINNIFQVVKERNSSIHSDNDMIKFREKSDPLKSSEIEDVKTSPKIESAIDVALDNLTYRELQQICKHSELSAKGKATELIDRIKEQFTVNPSSISLPNESSPIDDISLDFLQTTHIHRGHIRSGQQVSAEGKSLVVMGNVNPGGEVMADGDIYIFGKLQGRALAGLQATLISDKSNPCKIFVQHFDPELVGIGKVFTTVANIADIGLASEKNVIVCLSYDDGLDSNSLSITNA